MNMNMNMNNKNKKNIFIRLLYILIIFIIAVSIQLILVTSILYISAKGDREAKIKEVNKTFLTIGKFFGIHVKDEKKPLKDATDKGSDIINPKKRKKFTDSTVEEQPPVNIEIPREENTPVPDEVHGSNYQDEVIKYINQQSSLANSLYYSQLDMYGKIIYDKLRDESAYFLDGMHTFDYGTRFSDLLAKENGMQVLNKSFQSAINALSFDYPQLFFIDVTKIFLYVEKVNKIYKVEYIVKIQNEENKTFFIDELKTTSDVAKARENVEQIRREMIEKVGNNPYYAIKYVHDRLIDQIEYDLNNPSNFKFNLYSALVYSKAVCEGYAKAFKYIMDGLNIPTITVAGDGIQSHGRVEKHAWNIVFLNGSWYGVDLTWDDPVNLNNAPLDPSVRSRFLLKGKSSFEKSHRPTGNITPGVYFKYPDLSQSDIQF